MKKNIVITILAVLVIGLGCFIVYDKVIDRDEKKDNDVVEENKLESLSLDNDIVQTLYGYISFGNLYMNYSNLDSVFYDSEINSQLEKTDLLAKDLSDKTVLKIALGSVPSFYRELTDEEKNQYFVSKYYYNEKSVRTIIKRIFGSERENKIDLKTLLSESTKNLQTYKYDEQYNEIIKYTIVGGVTGYVSPTYQLVKAETDSQNIYIYEDVRIITPENEDGSDYTIKYTYKNDNGDYTFYRLQSYKK